ncbi:MAG: cysteine desulfurase [Magnetococcales bacterium]|nr:cysteine desulfurase [Magnetococcales bacterium]
MIYLDYNATAPLREVAHAAMLNWLQQPSGNPSSIHRLGRNARQALDLARRQVAQLFAVHDSQVIFTSGGTEANHLALFTAMLQSQMQGHIVTTAVEHASLLAAAEGLQRRHELSVTRVLPERDGRITVEAVASALRPDTRLVSVMAANNETGVLHPIAAIARLCHERGILCHSDAVQLAGRLPVTLAQLGCDLLSVSAHKMGGCPGVGALLVGKGVAVEPLLAGGGQERGRRSGTENLPGIVAFGAVAHHLNEATITAESQRICLLQTQLEEAIRTNLPDCVVVGTETERLANTTLVVCDGLDGEALVMNLDLAGFAVSGGAACSSGKAGLSHVLSAMGMGESLARSAVRISLGWQTEPSHITALVAAFTKVVERLRPHHHRPMDK